MSRAELEALIEGSGLFDPVYYRERYNDVATSPQEPFSHYLNWGASENRFPSAKFDPRFYAAQCALKGVDPGNCVVHYLVEGRAGGLFATPLEYTLQMTGVPALELVQQFESWGRDCEFGLFQRQLGAEPNDLFRFSDPTPEMLVQLIGSDFAGYGEECYIALDAQQPRREWFVVDHPTRISRHTGIFEGDIPQETVLKTARVWTRLLRAKAVREIAGGHKVYVIKTSWGDLTQEAVAAVARALRLKGSSWVLWVEAGEPVGHCEILMEGLLRARIDRLCVRGDEYHLSLAGWLQVICGAWNTVQKIAAADSPRAK